MQPRALPSVVGHGKTLEIAMASLLDQLHLGPQRGAQKDASTIDKEPVSKKAARNKRKKLAMMAAAEAARTAYVQDYNLRSKTKDQADPSVFISLPDSSASPGVLPIESVAFPNLQSPNAGSTTQPLSTTQPIRTGCVSPIEEDHYGTSDGAFTRVAPLQWRLHLRDPPSSRDSLTPKSVGGYGGSVTQIPGTDFEKYPTVPNMFRFGSSRDLLASLSKESVLHKTAESGELKKPGVKSSVSRQGDAWKQAHKKAGILPARQDLGNQIKTFNYAPPSSLDQGRNPQEAGLPSSRQEAGNRPASFFFTSPTKLLPGDIRSTSSLGRLPFSSHAPALPSVKVKPPVMFPSLDFKGDINTITFQTGHSTPVFSQNHSRVDDNPSTGHRSCSPDHLPQKIHHRVKRESSVSPIGRRPKKIKVEETT